MCICIYIHTYIYMYIYINIYTYIYIYTWYNFWRSYVSFGLSMANSLTCHFAFFSVMPGLRATQEVLQWDGKILSTQILVALKSSIFDRSFYYKPNLLGIHLHHLWSPQKCGLFQTHQDEQTLDVRFSNIDTLQDDLMFAHCLWLQSFWNASLPWNMKIWPWKM